VAVKLSLSQQIEKAAEVLHRGGLVVFPTDTVYGLAADPCNRAAVERLYEIKQRPRDKSLPLLASGVRQLKKIAELNPLARFLAARFWPGGLTLVLKRKISFPEYVSGGGGTIAVRVPHHRVPAGVARLLGGPVVGTSANLSGRPSALTASAATMQLGNFVDLIIDGGECPGGIESTIVDVTGKEPSIIRRGTVPQDMVAEAWKLFLASKA